MDFVHGVNLTNPYVCHNLALTGKLMSPNALALIAQGIAASQSRIESLPMDVLRRGTATNFAPTPRAANSLIIGGMLERGEKLYDGYGHPVLMSGETQQWHRNVFRTEMVFEERRRIVAPTAVSRLSCLWMAERTSAGTKHIQAMLGSDMYLIDVKIVLQIGLTRVDTQWFDKYCEDPKVEFADRYWTGDRCPLGETWEYLLDGVLALEREDQRAYIKDHGAHY